MLNCIINVLRFGNCNNEKKYITSYFLKSYFISKYAYRLRTFEKDRCSGKILYLRK